MQFAKSSQKLVDFFNDIAPNEKDGVEVKKMFGYPCRFVLGNMFTGLHEENMILRLNEQDRNELIKLGGSQFHPMPNRIMKEYIVVPKKMINDKNTLSIWLQKSLNYASSLPSKIK